MSNFFFFNFFSTFFENGKKNVPWTPHAFGLRTLVGTVLQVITAYHHKPYQVFREKNLTFKKKMSFKYIFFVLKSSETYAKNILPSALFEGGGSTDR